MLNQLCEKILEPKDPILFEMNQGEYYIEEVGDITYLVHPTSVVAFLPNGKVVRLGQKCNEFEWMLHNDLCDITEHYGCRIEIPLLRKEVKVLGSQYHYFEVQRPNYELGVHFIDESQTDTLNETYFMNYIEDTKLMMKCLKTLCIKHNYFFVPDELLAPYKRNKDSLGYFWIDFKNWNIPFYEFYQKKVKNSLLNIVIIRR